MQDKRKIGGKLLTVFFIFLCVVWVFPIYEVVINSLKANDFVKLEPFVFPTSESFVGLANYIKGLTFGNYPFLKSAGFSFFITVVSVALILLCCSMGEIIN